MLYYNNSPLWYIAYNTAFYKTRERIMYVIGQNLNSEHATISMAWITWFNCEYLWEIDKLIPRFGPYFVTMINKTSAKSWWLNLEHKFTTNTQAIRKYKLTIFPDHTQIKWPLGDLMVRRCLCNHIYQVGSFNVTDKWRDMRRSIPKLNTRINTTL